MGPSDTHLGAPHPGQRRQSPGLVTAGTASCQLSGAARGEAGKVRRKEWWGWVAVPSVDSGGVGVSVSVSHHKLVTSARCAGLVTATAQTSGEETQWPPDNAIS